MMLKEALVRQMMVPEVVSAIDALPNRLNAQGFDRWGFCPEEAKFHFSWAYRLFPYFRPEVHGAEHVPEGRVLIVPNHSGQIPFDGLMVLVAALLMCRPPRLVRTMVDRFVPALPFINEVYSRSGVVLGDPINCRNLLEDDQAILVFPEGTKGSGKVWKNRYKLAPFGRGFMRLALQTGSPIVPVSIIGAEESLISIHDGQPLARMLGLPYIPIHPLLPILGPLAYVPWPVRFHITFGQPMAFDGPFDDEDAVIDDKVEQVRSRIQSMVHQGLAARRSLFF